MFSFAIGFVFQLCAWLDLPATEKVGTSSFRESEIGRRREGLEGIYGIY